MNNEDAAVGVTGEHWSFVVLHTCPKKSPGVPQSQVTPTLLANGKKFGVRDDDTVLSGEALDDTTVTVLSGVV